MTPIIEVEGLGKRYRIGKSVAYRTLRDTVSAGVSAPLRQIRSAICTLSGANDRVAEVWALRDISFKVEPGEVIGIIGRNGSGKSTLLKLLSRITLPTEGRATLRGRVGSLLEVGTGFHPELTGRENIFLSGAIIGMRRAEIQRKLEEIVAFSEIDDFLDTPVKRYSSGMYMRLAFAVAAHLETEILLVDEVLAVGDTDFQRKCLGKISDVSREGRTVIFVSHNMVSVETLCSTCLLLSRGRIAGYGTPTKVLGTYMASMIHPNSGRIGLADHPGRRRSKDSRYDSDYSMQSLTLASRDREPVLAVRVGEPLIIRVSFSHNTPIDPVLSVVIKNSHGTPILSFDNLCIGGFRFKPAATGTISCEIGELPLMPGRYVLDLWLCDGEDSIDMIQEAISFEVESGDVFGTGRLPPQGSGQVVFPASFAFTTQDLQPVQMRHHSPVSEIVACENKARERART